MSNQIKIFELTDDSLKSLGNVIRNDNSRKIMLLLIKQELYVNKIAEILKIGVNTVSDNIKQMRELGLLEIKQKPINRKTKDHNFYRFKSDIFISAMPKKNDLKSFFKGALKLTSIGIAAIITFVLNSSIGFTDSENDDMLSFQSALFYPLIIIIISLCIERIFYNKKRKGN